MKLLLAALLVLALAAPLARVRPAGAITCDGGSDDGRMYTPEHVNYYYQADTTCPVAIYMVSVASWIEAKQLLPPYLDWERTHDFPDKFNPRFTASRAYVSDQFWVQPFNIVQPSNCRRVLSMHAIIVGAGAMDIRFSHSPGYYF